MYIWSENDKLSDDTKKKFMLPLTTELQDHKEKVFHNNALVSLKVDREDHFQRPGFLHIIICVYLGYKASTSVKNWMLPMFNPSPFQI